MTEFWKNRVFIIAEAGVNHNGSLDQALALVDVAAEAGADAVKFQTFKAEEVISRNAAKAEYQLMTTNENESQLEMAKKLELDLSAHKQIIRRCEMRKIQFLSTPFDLPSVDMLVKDLKVLRIKVSSGEITNSFVCRASSSSASSRERRCSLSWRIRLRMNSLGVP